MIWLVPAALLLDLLLGDPRILPHPVVLIGRLISRLEIWLAGACRNLRLAGVLLVLLTLLATGLASWALLVTATAMHPWLGGVVAGWLAYTTLALRSLHTSSREVITHLAAGEVELARRALSMIVGRDTAGLDEQGILKACIETVAENASDGVIAPLLYLFLGGPILALLFKASSTLDSMVGYLDDRYRQLGWASARLDDLLNLLPARLTAALMIAAAWTIGLNARQGVRMVRRDARKHKSPNAGYPEAAAAGILGIQLGGPAVYLGQRMEKATLGDAQGPVTIESYRQMIRLLYVTTLFAVGLGTALLWLLL
jgi:adenosylcobinamide-phosphate synthase